MKTTKLMFAALAASTTLAACSEPGKPAARAGGEDKSELYVIDAQLDDSPAKAGAQDFCSRSVNGHSYSLAYTTAEQIKTAGVCKGDADRPLTNIRFEFSSGSAELSREAKMSAHNLGRLIKATGATGITLTGNADSMGSEERNVLLSWKRAGAVAVELKKNMPQLDIRIEARGSEFCDTVSNYECRRVTIDPNNLVYAAG